MRETGMGEQERERDSSCKLAIVLGICEKTFGNQCFVIRIWERTPIKNTILYKIIFVYSGNDDYQ